jgi:hypothetical protein
MGGERTVRRIAKPTPDLHASSPAERLAAARRLSPRAIAKIRKPLGAWPLTSPGALNAWLLLVTTKSPDWRDPLLAFPEHELTLGEPHEGFFYPDPIGFWTEVRRWMTEVVKQADPSLEAPDALAVSALVHLGNEPDRLAAAMAVCRPAVVLFLDEPAWSSAGWTVPPVKHHVPDPHRAGQVYQGFWGRRADGLIVGKSPQHPSAHRFYAWSDMAGFLRSWAD